MEKKNPSALFVVLVFIACFLFLLDRWGVFVGVRSLVEDFVSPPARAVHKMAFTLPFLSNTTVVSLEEERNILQEKLIALEKLEKENEDLRLQLGIPRERGQKLMLAHVLSTGRFFIIDKGEDDGMRVGNTVIYKNIFVGKIIVLGKRTSRVLLPSEKDSVIGVKAMQTSALGNVYGQNNEMTLSEVTLTEAVKEGDVLQTVGDVDEKGLGVRPGLLVGKVEHIRKSEDQLFQEATIVPLLDYKTLQNVLIVL